MFQRRPLLLAAGITAFAVLLVAAVWFRVAPALVQRAGTANFPATVAEAARLAPDPAVAPAAPAAASAAPAPVAGANRREPSARRDAEREREHGSSTLGGLRPTGGEPRGATRSGREHSERHDDD